MKPGYSGTALRSGLLSVASPLTSRAARIAQVVHLTLVDWFSWPCRSGAGRQVVARAYTAACQRLYQPSWDPVAVRESQ
eukprot:6173550-Pleurochrysis_carterae.AAC.1